MIIHFHTLGHHSSDLSRSIFDWLDQQSWRCSTEAPKDWDYSNWCYDGMVVITFRNAHKAMMFKLAWAEAIAEQE